MGNSATDPIKEERSWMDPVRNLGVAMTNWTMRYIPDTWVIAIILTVVVFMMSLAWGNVTLPKAVGAWGQGLWSLLTLMAQFSFSIMIAYACASAPVMARALNWLASRPNPNKPWQAVLFMALFSLSLSWVNWAVSVTVAAMFAPYLAKHNPKTDFRLLVAGAYAGMATLWAAGLSGTATLLVASPDNFLMKTGVLKEIITVDRTIFSSINISMTVVAVVVVTGLLIMLTPRADKAYTLTNEEAEDLIQVASVERPQNPTFAEKLNWWPGWNILSAFIVVWFMVTAFQAKGLQAWDINMYNLAFLAIALVLTWHPVILFDALKKGIMGTWGIVMQFPFYGGIFGLVVYTDLGHFLTNFFASIATTRTYLPIVYWYSGILSYFVPSAGAKWAMEAPYLIPAAKQLGISSASLTLVYSWGDMMTHLLQPFWAIAILSITRMKFGQIAGFCALIWLVYAIVMSGMVFLVPLNL